MIAAVFVREADDERTRALVARCRSVTPRLRVEDRGLVVCDLAGLEGSPMRHGVRLVAASTRAGITGSVGIAATSFAASVLARRTLPPAVRVIEDAAGFLATLSLSVLPLDEKIADELRLLGLRRVSDFIALPRGAVLDRFGRAAAEAHALAYGEEAYFKGVWDLPPRPIVARRVWDYEIADRERLAFALRGLTDEVSGLLAPDGLAAVRLRAVLDRSEGPFTLERTILPPARESAVLLRSIRWGLEERADLGRVNGASIEVLAVEAARGRQVGLFAPDGARREEAIAAARTLRARLGVGRVIRGRIANSEARLPERAVEWDEVVK